MHGYSSSTSSVHSFSGDSCLLLFPPSLAPSLSEFEIRRRCFFAFQLLQPPSSSRALSATTDLFRQSIFNDTSGVAVILVWCGRVLHQLPGRLPRPLELCGQGGRQTTSQSPSIPKSTHFYSSHGIQRPRRGRSICKSRTLSARVRSHLTLPNHDISRLTIYFSVTSPATKPSRST